MSLTPAVGHDNKPIDDDLFKFVDQNILLDPQEDVLFLGWGNIYYLDRRYKPRMLVLTHFRLNVLKDSITGYSLRQTFLLLHLHKIYFETSNNGETGILTLTFHDDPYQKDFNLVNSASGEFKISYPMDRMKEILFPILSSVHAIRHNRKPIDLSSIPESLMKEYLPSQPAPDDQDGILASYLAECDRCLTPKRLGVLNYILSCFQIRDTTLNLSHIFKSDVNTSQASQQQQQRYIPDIKDLPRDILAIISSVRNFPYFDAILSFDMPLKEALIPIASVFDVEQSSYVKLLAITGAKFNRKSVDAFANGFSKGNHALDTIMFSNCDLGDYGVITICDALKKAEKPMESLSLAECGFSHKGFAEVVDLVTRDKIKQSVSALDIHGNKLGKGSTPSLITLLNCQNGRLGTLNIASCDVDIEILFRELTRAPLNNNKNVAASLCSLDISGHKLSSSAVKDIVELIKKTHTLTEIKFQNCNLSAQNMFDILFAAYSNPNKLVFDFDFSKNGLGSKGAINFGTAIAKAFESKPRPSPNNSNNNNNGNGNDTPTAFLQSLDLSDNNIGMDGLRKLCPMLAYLPVNALFLDNNYKPGLFKESSSEFHLTGVALSDLLQENLYIQEFSICGDDNNYALTSAIPTMLRRIENVTHLTALDIAGNRCGDEVIDEIARMIRSQTCQISNFSIDANRFSVEGFKRLYRIIHDAPASRVFTMEPLTSDAERISKTLKTHELQEFHLILTNLENILEQREQLSRGSSGPSSDDNQVDYASSSSSQVPEEQPSSTTTTQPDGVGTSSPQPSSAPPQQSPQLATKVIGGAPTTEDTFSTDLPAMDFAKAQSTPSHSKRPSILRNRRQSISSGGGTIIPDTIAQRRMMSRTMTGVTSLSVTHEQSDDSELIYQPTTRPSISNPNRPTPTQTPSPSPPHATKTISGITPETTASSAPPTIHQLSNQPPPQPSARPSISRPSFAAAQGSNYQPPPPQHLPRMSQSYPTTSAGIAGTTGGAASSSQPTTTSPTNDAPSRPAPSFKHPSSPFAHKPLPSTSAQPQTMPASVYGPPSQSGGSNVMRQVGAPPTVDSLTNEPVPPPPSSPPPPQSSVSQPVGTPGVRKQVVIHRAPK